MGERAMPRLLIAEEPAAASSMIEVLERHFGQACATPCPSAAELLKHDLDHVDLVLTTPELPDATGFDLLERIQHRRRDLPVVMVVEAAAVETAADAMARGAADLIVRTPESLHTLGLVVEKNLALSHERRRNEQLQAQLERSLEWVRHKNVQLERAVSQLERMAATDPLTGLVNRRAFARALDRAFADTLRHRHDLCCLMIDLDMFKRFNDQLGHQAGDRLLLIAARVLEANCRRSDVAGRYGGDELVLLLPHTGEAEAGRVAQRVREQFATDSRAGVSQRPQAAAPPPVTMSMGLASVHGCRPGTPEQLVAFADRALYQAKLAGKQRLVVYRRPEDRQARPAERRPERTRPPAAD